MAQLRDVYIGPVYATFVRVGEHAPLAERLEIWQVPGMNGVGAIKLGRSDSRFQCIAALKGTPAEITAWETALRALQGTIVAVKDDWATIHNLVLLEEVTPQPRRAEMGYGGCHGQVAVSGRYVG